MRRINFITIGGAGLLGVGGIFLQLGEQESDLNYSVLYRIGAPSKSLTRVFGTGLQKDILIDAQGVYPIAKVYDCNDPYIIGYIATVENFWEAYISDINEFSRGTPNWTKLHTKEDFVGFPFLGHLKIR